MSEPRWRVGTKVPRNIYFDNKPALVAVGCDEEAFATAAAVVEAMNAREQANEEHAALARATEADVVVNTDGGSRGNPGPAAWGYVMRTPDGKTHSDRARIGTATNNEAEYNGVLNAVRFAHRNYPNASLLIRCDSKLVVEQLKGTWAVNESRLQAFRDVILDVLKKMPKWSIEWVPREQNRAADALVNAALDGR